jgi:ABC-type transport system substrate-binding protein
LVGRAAQEVAAPQYLDNNGKALPDSTAGEQVAETVFDLKIRQGIRFAPHPAFAKNEKGDYRYHAMQREEVADKYKITDFKETGTRELTADDYVYGIRRLATPRIKSPSFSTMADYIVGLKEYGETIAATDKALRKNMAPTDRDLPVLDFRKYAFAGAQALDKYSLRIRVKGKYPQFKYWLAMTFFSPIPWEAEAFYAQPGMAAKNLTLNYWPVGTGPYMLTDFVENRRHVLERNPNFHGETYPCEGEPGDKEKGYLADCGKPIPFADKVVFDIEKEGVPLNAKFMQGYYDSPAIERLDYGTSMIVSIGDSKEKEKEFREKAIKLPTTIEANTWSIGFNWLDPVVGKGNTPEEMERNRKLRQALSIAIEWEEHIAIFEKGQGMPAQGPVPPSLFGYREDGPAAFNPVVYQRNADGKAVRRPIEDAKKLLAEAGYPEGRDAKTGKPLVLNFDYQSAASPGTKALLDWYTKQFAKIGLQLEIRATDFNRFQDKMAKGSVQIFFFGWLADYPDAENFLFMLYGPNSKAKTNGNGENSANYESPAFDKAYEKMKFLDDGPEKQKLIDEMITITQQDAVWSFGYFPTSAAAYHQWIYNGKPTQIVRNHISYLRLDPELRAKKIAEWNRPIWWPVPLILLALIGVIVPAWRGYRRREQETAARTLAVAGVSA